MKRKNAFITGIAFFLLLAFQPAFAAERILSLDSFIQVNPDGSMRVTELIRVRAEGRQIKRGFYRDFPTKYKDRRGASYAVDFEVLAVTRDGRPEPWFTKPIKNGVRTYIGNKNVHLRYGEYTYALTYRTNRQLGFFEKHDELYWNVTGTGWSFPIDYASATVKLPSGLPFDAVHHEGYTGPQGATGRDYTSRVSEENRVIFETTRPLGRYEGLTTVAMWPKGFVQIDLRTKLPPQAGANAAIGYVANFISAAGLVAGLAFAYFFSESLVQDPWSRIGILLFAVALLFVNGLFYHLMKAPTLSGRKLLDRVDGFEEYLKVAEEADLKLRNPPKKTPELFEKYLPYAMALDVEALWGDKFAAVLEAARRERAYSEPSWYSGSRWHSSRGPAGFASAMAGSLAVSAAAAASPPGSSGGGGGGGSSGGGGGGGW